MDSKALLRFKVLDRINTATIPARSAKIVKTLRDLPEYQTAQRLLLYSSAGHEVVTDSLFDRTKLTYLPFLTEIRIGLVNNLDDTDQIGKIRQPKAVTEASVLEQLDLVVIPGVAFNKQGYRIGRGGGWYDRFLPKVNPNIPRIGLCFSEQLEEFRPDSHDQPVDVIITEDQLIRIDGRIHSPASTA